MTLKKAFIPEPLPRFKACYTCKTRKVRCDGTHPTCQTCTKHYQSRGISPIPPCVYQDKDTCIKQRREKRLLKEASSGTGKSKGKGKSKEVKEESEEDSASTGSDNDHEHSSLGEESHVREGSDCGSSAVGGGNASEGLGMVQGQGFGSNLSRGGSELQAKPCCSGIVQNMESRIASLETFITLQFSTISSLRSELELYKSKFSLQSPQTLCLSNLAELQQQQHQPQLLSPTSSTSSSGSIVASNQSSRHPSYSSINSSSGEYEEKPSMNPNPSENFLSWDFISNPSSLLLQQPGSTRLDLIEPQPPISISSRPQNQTQNQNSNSMFNNPISQSQSQGSFSYLTPIQIQLIQQQQLLNSFQMLNSQTEMRY